MAFIPLEMNGTSIIVVPNGSTQGFTTTTPVPLLSTTDDHEINSLSMYGIPVSARLLIGVFAACGGLTVITLTIIIAKILCFKERSTAPSRSLYRSTDHLATSMESMASITLYGDEKRIRATTSPRSPNLHDKILLGNGNYSTFQNPAFRGDPQDRLHHLEVIAETSTDRYPWEIEAKGDNSDRWSNTSLQAVNDYDYKRYGKIPRARTEAAESYTSL